jgi:hypothetical protein
MNRKGDLSSPPMDNGILEAGITLFFGLLIFLTLRWQLDPKKESYDSAGHKYNTRLDHDIPVNRWFLFGMFISAGVTVCFALFPEIAFPVLSMTVPIARIAFMISIIIVIIFIIRIIRHPPDQQPQTRQGDDSLVEI